ncbi:NYN domain-containing protein [Patescibacteria group bacterium]|nr:NYN domain-containing protein [Patescibacteria group bacterium]
MDLEEFKTKVIKEKFGINSEQFFNIYTFVDFGNVRHWAKEFWPMENKYRICVEIDIEKLGKICECIKSQKRFFYYGYYPKRDDLDWNHPLNLKYRKSIARVNKAKESGFKKRTKEIKMIPHYDEGGKFIGKMPKCNFDVEITMDMLMKINKYDSVMLLSGDSDFGGLLSYLKSKGKKIIIVCTRNYMSTELESVKDKFIPAELLKDFLRFENKNTPPVKAEE